MPGDGGWHPLADGCPPEWASAWGEDQFGVFVEFRVGEVDQRMRWIRGGTFRMGSPPDDSDAFDDERPQHSVEITSGFWLADTPVTQALWEAVRGANPSDFKGDPRRPVEQVSWEECQHFCDRLRDLLPGPAFRLPTEAEWEYACRAGTTEPTYARKLGVRLDDIAWYANNSEQTHPVREKLPNPWGLYDTLGSVWEWCSDWFSSYGPATGERRVLRGGSWFDDARLVRAGYRHALAPGIRHGYLGLRLAREQGGPVGP